MGFWESFFGAAVGAASVRKSSGGISSADKRYISIMDELQQHENWLNSYLDTYNIPWYIYDSKTIDAGMHNEEKKFMQKIKFLVGEYIRLGGNPKFVTDPNQLDFELCMERDIEVLKYLKSQGIVDSDPYMGKGWSVEEVKYIVETANDIDEGNSVSESNIKNLKEQIELFRSIMDLIEDDMKTPTGSDISLFNVFAIDIQMFLLYLSKLDGSVDTDEAAFINKLFDYSLSPQDYEKVFANGAHLYSEGFETSLPLHLLMTNAHDKYTINQLASMGDKGPDVESVLATTKFLGFYECLIDAFVCRNGKAKADLVEKQVAERILSNYIALIQEDLKCAMQDYDSHL